MTIRDRRTSPPACGATPPRRGRAGRTALLAVVAACFVFSLTGCETDGIVALTPEQRAAQAPLHAEELASLGYRPLYRGFASMTPGHGVRWFDVLGDALAVQDTAGVVTVLDTLSGAQRWSDQPAGELTKFVGNIRDGARLIVSSETEVFFYDLQTGNLLTKQRLSAVVNTRPVRSGPVLVYGTTSGLLFGHNADNGFRAWGATLSGPINYPAVEIPGAGVLVAASANGDVLTFDGPTGAGAGRSRMFSGPGAPPAAGENDAVIASSDHSLYCFAGRNAAQLWRIRTQAPLRSPPTVHDGRVFVDLGEQGLSAVEVASGSIAWNNPDLRGRVFGFAGGRPLLWDGSRLTRLDPRNGKVIDAVTLTQVDRIVSEPFVDGTIFTISPGGVVSRFDRR